MKLSAKLSSREERKEAVGSTVALCNFILILFFLLSEPSTFQQADVTLQNLLQFVYSAVLLSEEEKGGLQFSKYVVVCHRHCVIATVSSPL